MCTAQNLYVFFKIQSYHYQKYLIEINDTNYVTLLRIFFIFFNTKLACLEKQVKKAGIMKFQDRKEWGCVHGGAKSIKNVSVRGVIEFLYLLTSTNNQEYPK